MRYASHPRLASVDPETLRSYTEGGSEMTDLKAWNVPHDISCRAKDVLRQPSVG